MSNKGKPGVLVSTTENGSDVNSNAKKTAIEDIGTNIQNVSKTICTILEELGSIEDTKEHSLLKGITYNNIYGSLNSLSIKEIVTYTPILVNIIRLTNEGQSLVKNGSYEAQLYKLIPDGPKGISHATLNTQVPEIIKYGLGKAIKNKWVSINSERNIVRLVDSVIDQTQLNLMAIADKTVDGINNVNTYKKQNYITIEKTYSYSVFKGPMFSNWNSSEEVSELTSAMLHGDKWKSLKFKKYNIDADGIQPSCGSLHPVMETREFFRRVLLNLGFSEMYTNQYVESSLWNFDALFTPQNHPVRDTQDTFYLKFPATADNFEPEFAERVKGSHEGTMYDTLGYRTPWDIEKSRMTILRTHTTAITAKTFSEIVKNFKPGQIYKYFSIDRVFRNETLDNTHVPEFHQVEGFILGENLSIAHLIGALNDFYARIGCGLKKLVFKPAYNPYTKPSMEIFTWHEGFNKYVEVGNSGVFRKEVLLPFGFAPNVSCIAWGLSLERPAMINYGIQNMRDMVGHKCILKDLRSGPKVY